jgi:hypothetical protein
MADASRAGSLHQRRHQSRPSLRLESEDDNDDDGGVDDDNDDDDNDDDDDGGGGTWPSG